MKTFQRYLSSVNKGTYKFWTYLSVAQASINQLRGPEAASDVNSRAVFAGANISSISGCQFQIFNGPVNFVLKRRRFHIIESDEED